MVSDPLPGKTNSPAYIPSGKKSTGDSINKHGIKVIQDYGYFREFT
jgi:hypothetical protein